MNPTPPYNAVLIALFVLALAGLFALVFAPVFAPVFLMMLGVAALLVRAWLGYTGSRVIASMFSPIGDWLATRLERLAERYPRVAFAIFFSVVVPVIAIFLLFPLYVLWEAWQTGSIAQYRWYTSDLTYTVDDNPVGFWMTAGQFLFMVVMFWGAAVFAVWLIWSARHLPVNSRRRRRPQPPMEDMAGDPRRTRMRVDER
jgi:MFS family permease